MLELFTKHGDILLLVAFLGMAFLLHAAFKKRPSSKRPNWMREWIWEFLCPMRAALLFNGLILVSITLLTYADITVYRDAITPLTSVGLAWLMGSVIATSTKSVFSAWLIGFSLGIMGLLHTVPGAKALRDLLDDPAYVPSFGNVSITPYLALKTVLTISVFFLVAGSLLQPVEGYLRRRRDIKASSRNLIIQMLKIILYTSVGLISLNILGVNLTTLTVFGGALGVGLGFGLQKITSNFVSGIILLLEQSLEEGNLIELTDGTLGFIRKNGARYTLIETFDSKEILVPNEDFITNRVTNWTYSNPTGRIEVNVGVSYKSDIELARKLILEAAKSHPNCIDDPAPICYLNEFGDSSVNFILHFWISDIKVGRLRPQDIALTKIWHSFKEHGIEIPFPQRDVHLKSAPESQETSGGQMIP